MCLCPGNTSPCVLLCLLSSPQLAVVMWLLTYVGAVFNGITILILGKHRGNQETCHIHHAAEKVHVYAFSQILTSKIIHISKFKVITSVNSCN